MSLKKLGFLALTAIFTFASASAGPIPTYNADGWLESISDLDVDGDTFNLAVVYDTPFADVFGTTAAPDPIPEFWLNPAGAISSTTAIRTVMESTPPPPPPFPGFVVLVPYQPTSFDPPGRFDNASVAVWDDGGTLVFNSGGGGYNDVSGHPEVFGLATFTSTAIPEPSSLILLLLGAAGLFASTRRRRR